VTRQHGNSPDPFPSTQGDSPALWTDQAPDTLNESERSAQETLPPADGGTLVPPSPDAQTLVPPVSQDRGSLPPSPDAQTLVPPTEGQVPGSGWEQVPDTVVPGEQDYKQSAESFPEVPGYEILSELGRGGMGVVYKARQVRLKRIVALKMVLGDRAGLEAVARFRAEAQAVALLSHPNIVQVYEVGEHRGQPFFSLEFVPGGSLDSLLRGNPQPAHDCASLTRTLALAMQAAHDKGVIHRDLKPANILVAASTHTDSLASSSGSTLAVVPKISDFGLAKQLDDDSGQTRSGAILGTPSYMAPEQAEGKSNQIGAWTDVWALGAILYELLTGRAPFKGHTVWETIDQVCGKDPVPPHQLQPKVPRDLETIALKCLRKDPTRRYPSVLELADDLGRYLENRPILARPASAGERLVKWARRSPLKASALAFGIVVILLTLGLALEETRSARQKEAIARREAELEREQREHQEAELRQQRQREQVRAQVSDLYARAAHAADAAGHDTERWQAVERDAAAGLALLDSNPALESALRARLEQLRDRARGHLADARDRQASREKLARFHAHLNDAAFFSIRFSGLELAEEVARTRAAVRAGLGVFGVSPVLDRRFFSPLEIDQVVDGTFELLLFDAEAVAIPVAGETPAQRTKRLGQALNLLAEARKLRERTHAELLHRAEYLEQIQDDQAARKARAEAEKAPPSLASDHFLVGRELYKQGKYASAVGSLISALRQQSDHFGARLLLAVCRIQQNQWAEARVSLNLCLEQRPGFVWPRLFRGFAAMRLREFTDARDDFTHVLDNPPDRMAQYVALVNLGVLESRQKHWGDALNLLKRAVAVNPDAFPAYVNLASVRREQVDFPPWQEGLATLGWMTPALSLHPVCFEALRRSAWTAAIADLDRALERRPDVPSLYHERGRLYLLLGNKDQARRDFSAAILKAPTMKALAGDLMDLGKLLHKSGDHEAAVRAYELVLKARPDLVIAWRLKAEPLLSLGRGREAAEALDHYLAEAPAPVSKRTSEETHHLGQAWKARGLLHAQAGDFRAAIDSYTQGLAVENDPEMFRLRAWTYDATGAMRLALADFEQVLKQHPQDGDAILGRAACQFRLGAGEEAVADVDRAVRLGPPTSRLFYVAARIHAQAAGRPLDGAGRLTDWHDQQAVSLLRRALALEPAKKWAAFWRDRVQVDTAFAPIRRGARMTRLAAEILSGKRER
jgi:eukaryotic-like serine/threonine-protein kinase